MIKKTIGLKVLILPLTLALAVTMSVFFVKPAFEDMNLTRKKLLEKKEELATLQLQEQKLTELNRAFESLAKEKKDLAITALPEEENTEDYLSELYQRALKTGVLMSDFTVSEKTTQSNATYICGSSAAASDNSSATVSEASSGISSPGGPGVGSGVSAMSATQPISSASSFCVQGLDVQISVQGTWDQFLNFYKYLADSNRIANLSKVSISSKIQASSGGEGSQGSSSDLLSSQIGLVIYYKPKSKTSNQTIAKELVSGKSGLDQAVLKKLEEIVYLPYVEPAVSETGERNFFK